MSDPLAARLAEDAGAAFPDLVDTHGSMVLSLATRLTDLRTGEDITQEVFLRAYRSVTSVDPRHVRSLQLRPWLATITRNLVRNEYRRRERRPVSALDHEPSGASLTSQRHFDPAEVAVARAERETVDALLDGLSDAQRDAIVLFHGVGLSMREVALALGCAEGTAKSHVSRGLARVRERVEEGTIDG